MSHLAPKRPFPLYFGASKSYSKGTERRARYKHLGLCLGHVWKKVCMFIKLVCSGTAVIAAERGIFAKEPPGRRRMAAEKAGSRDVLMRGDKRRKGCGLDTS